MFKFLHAADIHLDSPLRGLERYEGAPVDAIREATRRALMNLVELALGEEVQFVVLAGDLYDGDWKDYNTGLFFVRQMNRLHEAGVPVVLIAGNHDAANRMTRTLRLPGLVTMLGCETPQTHLLPRWHVAVHGQSFATPAVTEDLSLRYPDALAGHYNIGLLHTCATGKEGHERYAPCTVEGLLAKRYDYWALGHVHQRDVLHEAPFIVFPGNLQGRHIRERGRKGCMLVEVDDAGRTRVDFRAVDVFRWELCEVAVDQVDEEGVLLDLVRDRLTATRGEHELPRAVRVVVQGNTALHNHLLAEAVRLTNEVRALADGGTWIEKVQWRTEPEIGPMSWTREGPLGELLGLLHELQTSPTALQGRFAEMKDLQDLAKKMQQHVGIGLPFKEAEWVQGLLEQAGAMLTRHLFSRGITG